jgi:hypothetical protein
MKIKRTTMIPQVYQCDPKIDKNKKYAKDIRAQNLEINNKIIKQTENKTALTIEDCYEHVYKVPPIENFIKLPNNTNVAIFDIPGLNDSQTKSTYFSYLNENFYKFDYILFVIEISRWNYEEKEILKLLNENITNIKKKFNKDIKLLVVCNKCDNMGFNEETKQLVMDDDELEEMYDQIINDLKDELKIQYDIIKYSAQYTYIYRMLAAENNLDMKDLDKIGHDQFGRDNWTEIKKESTEQKLISILKNKIKLEVKLTRTGYSGLIKKITDSLSSIHEILISKIHVIEDKILKKEKQLVNVNYLFDNIYNYIKEIKNISKDVDFNSIIINIKEYWHNIFSSVYPFTVINSTNHNHIKDNYYLTLLKLKSKYTEVDFDKYIDNYVDRETEYFLSNLDTIISNSYTFDSFIEILTNIFDNNKGTLPIDKIIKCIYKIPINDIHNLILKLVDYDISYEDTCKIYINYYKNYNYCIPSQIDKIKMLMLSKLLMKEYISTNNISYSLLSLIVEHNANNSSCKITSEYLVNDLEKDIESYLEPFKIFIRYINKESIEDTSDIDLLSIENETETKRKKK